MKTSDPFVFLRVRWIAEITWVDDWPGVGERVKRQLDTLTLEWKPTDTLWSCRDCAGTGAGIVTVVYHAANKRITGTYVDVSGVAQLIYFKRNGTWIEDGKGVLPDGRAPRGQARLVSDNGNTMVLAGSGTTGGKKQDDRHDVVHRRVRARTDSFRAPLALHTN